MDPNSNPKVASHTNDGKKRKVSDTDTANGNSPYKLLINRLIPEIIPVFTPSIYQTTVNGVAASRGSLYERQMILSQEILTDAAHSATRIFKDPTVVNWIDTDGKCPRDGNNV